VNEVGPPSWVARCGVTGGVLGVAAGLGQLVAGARIPEWTGAKADPLGLGLLTVALSTLALVCARGLRRGPRRPELRVVCGTGLLLPGALCFSTVGMLWYLPGTLLVVAGSAAVFGVGARELGRVLTTYGLRILISTLGGLTLLMVAGGSDRLTIVLGVIGGLALMAAPWVGRSSGRSLLLVLGVLPFALWTWWSLVPVVVAVLAGALAAIACRTEPPVRLVRPVRRSVGSRS
jgi:hypothetical protein